jgi:hypothetical protein
MFLPTSRYNPLEIAEWTSPSSRIVRYVRRRFIPLTSPPPLAHHTVVAGDRLDNVTARYLGDPEQFWRVCDANRAERPADLTAAPGRVLVIPMPILQGP